MKPLPLILFLLLFVMFYAKDGSAKTSEASFEYLIGQKIMLDFRYFCAEPLPQTTCEEPVLHLTDELAEVLVTGRVGGVILFSENIQHIEQVVKFVYDMQTLMKQHDLPPLFIAIDQEGGRVARFPDHIATRFVGNMAIGATFEEHGVEYAKSVAGGIAKSLKLFGINVNFAPSVDVNVNPDNPVINVRSYGESPAIVSELGLATVDAFQQHQLISAIKHFPGHGDTQVDSHSGLPRVDHTRNEIEAKDILPFRAIIASKTPPAMVMSAHIQYPALDDSKLLSKKGKETVVPATLSRKILFSLLRQDMAFNGVIITDALDMQAIAQFFTPADATLHAFKAGADIALMPYMIRSKADIRGFWDWQSKLIKAVQSGELNNEELRASVERIKRLKKQFRVGQFLNKPMQTRIKQAKEALPSAANKKLEKQLARDSITTLIDKATLPLSDERNWQIVMPDAARCNAIIRSVKTINNSVSINCTSLAKIPEQHISLSANDALIVGDITPLHASYEMGGMDPVKEIKQRATNQQQHDWLLSAMQQAKSKEIPVVLIAMRAPYVVADFALNADVALATYGYNVEVEKNVASGAVFETIAEVLLGKIESKGTLPVTVEFFKQAGE